MTSISERVAAGATWLDSRLPNWWQTHRIDLDSFEMHDDCRCVVGQLSPQGHYGEAVEEWWLDLSDDVGRSLGFFAGDAIENRVEYDQLTREWTRVITSRREATPDGR